jgi:hypothetical protein
MSCIATIKSPINGKPINSPTYYQLTSFFSQEKGKEIYQALTTEVFKTEFGFDWTKPQLGYSPKINYAGEPKMSEINKHLNLRMTEEQLRSSEQIEEIGALGYIGTTFNRKEALDNILFQINMNPKFDMINAEVISVGNKYQLSVRPVVDSKIQGPISKDMLTRFQFPGFIIDGVQDFNNTSFQELVQNLSNSSELDPFQQEMLKKLAPLIGKNTKLKLSLFDDIGIAPEYQRSFYDPKTNTVYIAKSLEAGVDKKLLVQEIIHEAIHAFTVEVLNNPKNAIEVEFVREIEKYFNTYKNYYPEFKAEYGFKNVDEFVAEFLSNPEFRLALQEAELRRSTNVSFIDKMWNSIKGFFNRYLFNEMSGSLYNNVQETLDGYFNYLMTLQDYPESQSETQVRFSQPFGQRSTKPYISEKLQNFYNYVDQNVDSSLWGQLSKSFAEISPEFNSIRRIQETFGKISTSDIKNSLLGAVRYPQDLANLLQKVQRDLENLTSDSNTRYYNSEELLRKLNSAIVLAQTLKAQMNFFQTNVVDQLAFEVYKNTTEDQERNIAENRNKANIEVGANVQEIKEEISKAVNLALSHINSIETLAKSKMIDPVAATVASQFSRVAEQLKDPNHRIQIEKAELLENLARSQDNPKLKKKIQKDLDDIETALNFSPTVENIKKLLNAANEQSLRNASIITRYFAVGGMTGIPIVDIVNVFINNHVTEAQNKSFEIDAKIRKIEERVSARNKRKGIGKSLLSGVGQVRQSALAEAYTGFFRIVPVKYYNLDGEVKIITQKVYNTPMKEAEFQNDYADLQQAIFLAKKSGKEDAIAEAQKNLEQFIQDYAQTEFVPEYYEAEKLLTDEAREARANLQEEIENLSSVFGVDDLDVDIANPVKGSKKGNQPTVKEARAKLRREYTRLGSIYNEDGTEKPIGSKERNIADSIIAYNKARKGLDIIEFVLNEETLIKFKQIKDQFPKKISALQAKITQLQNLIDDAQIKNDLVAIESYQSEIDNARVEIQKEKQAEELWLSQNTRVEILPEFFEEQQAISDNIKNILSKYGDNPEITEKYEKLFSAVKGYRDQDGIIAGTLVGEGLTKTVKDLEQSIEDLKKEVKENQEISKEDKDLLKAQFSKLYNLQSKVNTPYYKSIVSELKNKLNSQLSAAEKADLEQEAIEHARYFLEHEGTFKDMDLFNPKNFDSDDQEFDGIDPDDYLAAEADYDTLKSKFYHLLTAIAVNSKYKETDWYKNNHIQIEYEQKTGENAIRPNGEIIPITKTMTEMRPIYIWRKTMPNNQKYIRRNTPSFDWAVPRIRPEYKNPNFNFLGDYRPRQNAKDDKYVNPEYEKLDTEEKEIMNDILDVYEERQKVLPPSQRLNAYTMPNVGKESKEEQVNFYRPAHKTYTFLNSFRLFFKENVAGIEQDEEQSADLIKEKRLASKLNSGSIRLIKTRYKQPLNHVQSTDNILGALSAFSVYTAEFDGLKKALPAIFALKDKFSESTATARREREKKYPEAKTRYQKIKRTVSQGVDTVVSATKNIVSNTDEAQSELIEDMITDQIERFFYGAELRSGRNNAQRVLTRIGAKVINKTQKYALQLNVMRVPKNVTANILNGVGNASKFGLSKQDMLNGMAKAAINRSKLIGIEQGFTEMHSYVAKAMYFRAIPLADPTQLYRSINSSYAMRYLTFDNFGAQVFSSTEAMSTLGIYEAVMAKSYVESVDFNTGAVTMIPLGEAYDYVNGVLIPKDGVMGINRTRLNEILGEQNDYILKFLLDNKVGNIKELPPVKQVQLSKEIKSKFEAPIKAEEFDIKIKLEKLRQVEQEARDKIFQLYTASQGNYFKRGTAYYESIILLKFFMSMKRWLYPGLKNKFGGKSFNVITGNIDQGFYNTFFQALDKKIRSLRLEASSLSADYGFTSREREAAHRVQFELASIAVLYGLARVLHALALSSISDDEEDEGYLTWLLSLSALMALGSLDEYGTLNPIIGPTSFYNKIKTDPTKKAYEDKGPIDALQRSLTYAWFGQQTRTLDQILEGYGILGEALSEVPENLKDWSESGEGITKLPSFLRSPYFEQSRQGQGMRVPNPRVPAYENTSKYIVGMSKATGLELSVKSLLYPQRKLEQQVKFTPIIGFENPQGRLNELNNDLTKYKKEFSRISTNDIAKIQGLVTVKRNEKGEPLRDKKGKFIFDIDLDKYQKTNFSFLSPEKISEIIIKVSKAQEEKDMLANKYPSIKEYEDNLRTSQREGKLLSDLFDEVVEGFSGYTKEKYEQSVESALSLKELAGILEKRTQKILDTKDVIRKNIDENNKRSVIETKNLLPPE